MQEGIAVALRRPGQLQEGMRPPTLAMEGMPLQDSLLKEHKSLVLCPDVSSRARPIFRANVHMSAHHSWLIRIRVFFAGYLCSHHIRFRRYSSKEGGMLQRSQTRFSWPILRPLCTLAMGRFADTLILSFSDHCLFFHVQRICGIAH